MGISVSRSPAMVHSGQETSCGFQNTSRPSKFSSPETQTLGGKQLEAAQRRDIRTCGRS
jgi:hypothetical protein